MVDHGYTGNAVQAASKPWSDLFTEGNKASGFHSDLRPESVSDEAEMGVYGKPSGR
ncbi:MAG: hypothetical protein ACPHJ3_00705 [Rubripirellula sp.]